VGWRGAEIPPGGLRTHLGPALPPLNVARLLAAKSNSANLFCFGGGRDTGVGDASRSGLKSARSFQPMPYSAGRVARRSSNRPDPIS